VPAYTVVDARIGWRVTRDFDLSLVVQNALDREHAEAGAEATRAVFGRTYLIKAQWKL
jgi:iron complex outermembrane receptor protein